MIVCDVFVIGACGLGSVAGSAAASGGMASGWMGNEATSVSPMSDLNPHPYQAPLQGPEAMLTLLVTLQGAGQQLALAVAKPEWLGLVSHFTRMPPVERTRVGHSIQAATAQNPFPVNDEPLSPKQAALCETFVGDCVLLAALAEATTPRVLEGTALATYRLQNGNAARAQFH